MTLHGGRLIARRLKAHGVTTLFTLSGGHLFSIYDGCRTEGIDLVDVRHESAAAFAAEGWAKVTREPGVCALIPFVRPLVKLAATAATTAEIPGLVDEALDVAQRPHPGPTFLDFPLDQVFMEAPEQEDGASALRDPAAARAAGGIERAAALLRDAERPVIMAGTNLYWGHGEDALRELAEAAGIPVVLNGLARGCLPADHELFFARARSAGLKGADVALGLGAVEHDQLGLLAEGAAEAEPEVHRHADHERDVGALQRHPSCARLRSR